MAVFFSLLLILQLLDALLRDWENDLHNIQLQRGGRAFTVQPMIKTDNFASFPKRSFKIDIFIAQKFDWCIKPDGYHALANRL